MALFFRPHFALPFFLSRPPFYITCSRVLFFFFFTGEMIFYVKFLSFFTETIKISLTEDRKFQRERHFFMQKRLFLSNFQAIHNRSTTAASIS